MRVTNICNSGVQGVSNFLERCLFIRSAVGQFEFTIKPYEQNPDSQISSVQKPECPTAQPPISIFQRNRKNRSIEDVEENRTFIAIFHNASDGHGELEVR
jgi:hypothetical protein